MYVLYNSIMTGHDYQRSNCLLRQVVSLIAHKGKDRLINCIEIVSWECDHFMQKEVRLSVEEFCMKQKS